MEFQSGLMKSYGFDVLYIPFLAPAVCHSHLSVSSNVPQSLGSEESRQATSITR